MSPATKALSGEAAVIAPQTGPQEDFNATSTDIAIAGGAAGGGKTWALLLEALRWVHLKDFRAVIFRRTTRQIRKDGGLWDESAKIYPRLGATPREQYLDWTFPSGARISFEGMEHEKDRFDYDGSQIPLVMFDQLESFTERQFWYMQSRNRSASVDFRPYVRATCNPVPPDADPGGWLNELLSWWWDAETGYALEDRSGAVRWLLRVEDEVVWFGTEREALTYRDTEGLPGEVRPLSVTFVPSTVEDNPLLAEHDPMYLSRLASLSHVERERLRYGNWLVQETAGMIFDRSWFDKVEASPNQGEVVRYWDKAGTEGGGARSAGTRVRMHEGTYYVEDVVQGQWSYGQRENVIQQTAESDGYGVTIIVEQEPGSSGKESAQSTIQNLAGYDVHADKVTGSKVDRAKPMSAQAEAGNVKLVKAPWNESFLRQAQRFEEGASLIDAVDAACGAFNRLTIKDEQAGYTFRWG